MEQRDKINCWLNHLSLGGIEKRKLKAMSEIMLITTEWAASDSQQFSGVEMPDAIRKFSQYLMIQSFYKDASLEIVRLSSLLNDCVGGVIMVRQKEKV